MLTVYVFFQEVTGIYANNFDLSLNKKNGFPVFETQVEANYVAKQQDLFSAYKLTQEDKEEIEKLAKDHRIGERVCYEDKFVGIVPCYLSMEDCSSYFVYFCRLLNILLPLFMVMRTLKLTWPLLCLEANKKMLPVRNGYEEISMFFCWVILEQLNHSFSSK